ncbi:MAG: AAA family ATPase [Deltaproteobacteria bacterium]|nr:AAA family ATPase [Deltaproteobacteria bacterium]
MDYFKILNLKKEPFSNSPDPDFFFHSRQHMGCLQKVELALRLQKGLNVVIGDVGTGKTTLCRQLIRNFASDDRIETHLILDPHFSSPSEFLALVTKMLWKARPKKEASDWQLKELIKKYLFRRGVNEGKNIILLIDEGQKLPDFCLESLREFLNYETNEHKLLQIVIFAQKEFEEVLAQHKNFADRINLFHNLSPLNFEETRAMITFRLHRAGNGQGGGDNLFSFPALWAIYRTTEGYPRKIINLCHRIVLSMIIQNGTRAGWLTARTCSKRYFPKSPIKQQRSRLYALTGLLLACVLLVFGYNQLTIPTGGTSIASQKMAQSPTPRKDPIPVRKTIPPEAPIPEPAVTPPAPEPLIKPLQAKETAVEIPKKSDSTPVSSPAIEEKAFPTLLGHLTVNRKETIGGMIQRVYGEYTNEYLRLLTQANRNMANPNRLVSGQVIRFPAIPSKAGPKGPNICWVEIARMQKLQEAYKFLKDYPVDRPPIRLIPYWNRHEGLNFVLVDKKLFADEESAKQYLKRLQPAVASTAEIRTGWGTDSVLFANPVL